MDMLAHDASQGEIEGTGDSERDAALEKRGGLAALGYSAEGMLSRGWRQAGQGAIGGSFAATGAYSIFTSHALARRLISTGRRRVMTYVVTEACVKCKYTDCVDVCPVDCFREGPNFLVIDPDECIDCTLCVAECPVEAIYAEDDVPADQQDFVVLNAELARLWKPIVERKEPLPDADAWAKEKDKRDLLER